MLFSLLISLLIHSCKFDEPYTKGTNLSVHLYKSKSAISHGHTGIGKVLEYMKPLLYNCIILYQFNCKTNTPLFKTVNIDISALRLNNEKTF